MDVIITQSYDVRIDDVELQTMKLALSYYNLKFRDNDFKPYRIEAEQAAALRDKLLTIEAQTSVMRVVNA